MMGRAERRRTQKLEQKAKTATYNLTKEQLNIAVREQVGKELERIKQEATDDAVNTAMVLLLTLPLEVLMDHYWTKTYAKRIPRFTELVLEYYERWQNGELDIPTINSFKYSSFIINRPFDIKKERACDFSTTGPF